jgi:F-type H+-transporting ATPase subunit b
MRLLAAGLLTLNGTLIAQLLIFLLMVLALYRLAWGPVLTALETRRRRIAEGLEAAEEAKRQRQLAEQEYREKLEEARREGQALIDQVMKRGEVLRQELEAKAKEQADQVIARARAEIQAERQRAVQELRTQVADLAVLAAERIVGESLDQRKHRELIERVIQEAELRA